MPSLHSHERSCFQTTGNSLTDLPCLNRLLQSHHNISDTHPAILPHQFLSPQVVRSNYSVTHYLRDLIGQAILSVCTTRRYL